MRLGLGTEIRTRTRDLYCYFLSNDSMKDRVLKQSCVLRTAHSSLVRGVVGDWTSSSLHTTGTSSFLKERIGWPLILDYSVFPFLSWLYPLAYFFWIIGPARKTEKTSIVCRVAKGEFIFFWLLDITRQSGHGVCKSILLLANGIQYESITSFFMEKKHFSLSTYCLWQHGLGK